MIATCCLERHDRSALSMIGYICIFFYFYVFWAGGLLQFANDRLMGQQCGGLGISGTKLPEGRRLLHAGTKGASITFDGRWAVVTRPN